MILFVCVTQEMAIVFQNREELHQLFDIQGGRAKRLISLSFGAERFIW